MVRSFGVPVAVLAMVACFVVGATASAGILDASGEPDPAWESDAMLLWLKADVGFAPSAWTDQSNHGYVATQSTPAEQPAYSATAVNGTAGIVFDGNDYMSIAAGPSGQQTAFFVYKDTSTASWATPLGTSYISGGPGDDTGGSYHGQSNDSGLFSATYTDNRTRSGDNARNGMDIGDGTTTPRPDDWAIDVHVATAPLVQTISTVGSDSLTTVPSRRINGGIAEMIVYDRALSATEIDQVGHYLEAKYSIPTTYGTDLVSYWTFDDGTSSDTIGPNHGTDGSAVAQGAPGVIGQAPDFQGQPGNNFNANITVPAGHTLNAATGAVDAITLEAWVQPDDISTNTYSEVMRQQGPQYKFISFQDHGTAIMFQLEGSYIKATGLNPADFEDGDWHHIAGTYDGTTQRLYVDGTEILSKDVALNLSTSAPPAFVIGNLNLGSSYSEAFDGRIDEVAVWDDALTADEIKHHWVNRQPYTTRLLPNTTTHWDAHTDWDPTDGIPGEAPSRAWYYQKLSSGQYTDLTNWGRHSWWDGGNARRDPSGYPVVGPRVGDFDHLESTVDAYILANGLDEMDLIGMHPGSSDSQTAVVTWRNPLPGTNDFFFDGIFWHIDDTGTNGVDVSISLSDALGLNDALLAYTLTGLNADTMTLDASNVSLPDNAPFGFRLTLDYGDEVHFRVNARGAHGSDATMFGCRVALVPEPATIAILLGGLGLLRARRRRR